VFFLDNFFPEKFGEETSLNIVLLGLTFTRDRFQKYGMKKLTGASNSCRLIGAMKGVTLTRFLEAITKQDAFSRNWNFD